MAEHICDEIIITCIDFRFQEYIEKWINERYGKQKYDRVALAGAIFDLNSAMKQIDISNRLHKIKTVVLVNHEDCGAYGEAGTAEKHREDLLNAKQEVNNKYPHLNVETYYLHLDGKFEEIN